MADRKDVYVLVPVRVRIGEYGDGVPNIGSVTHPSFEEVMRTVREVGVWDTYESAWEALPKRAT